MFLAFLYAALPLFALCVKEEYYVSWQASWNCTAASSSRFASLPFVVAYVVLYNKKTRLIIEKSQVTSKQTLTTSFTTAVPYGTYDKFDFNEVEAGFYAAFIRVTEERKSESPVTNVVLVNYTDYEDKKLPPSGTDNDFSSMYYDAPVVPWFMFSSKYRDQVRVYESSCIQTGGFIANQGYYKFDTETKEWTPIYYDPLNADFYY
ncbi:hypothetical protein GCK32_002047 [Trichostrongylus colubriformis]|uniref:Uncharacterized protein n=1 Tax=Trichostrongylus colubriformis TaxID=6319 RepID=A0AAN8FNI3_TRICO